MNISVYRLYKPLKNHLNKISIKNGLYVIWAYINFLQFNGKFPRDIEVSIDFLKNKENIPLRGIFEWELALLAREVILNGQENPIFAKKDFNKWTYFSSAINKLKSFENGTWSIFGATENITKEISRVAKRQFPWQKKVSLALFFRYYKIFNNSRISPIVEKHLGLSVKNWYTIGIATLGASLTNCKFNIDPNIQIAGLTINDFDKFFSYTSTTTDNLKCIIERDVNYDEEFIYSFNPLEFYPFVKIENYYYCPVNTFIAWRITSGIYYDMDKNDGEFGRNFGLAFQDYLFEISKEILDSEKYVVLTEMPYSFGTIKKDSVDMIISDDKSAFFVEAKTKRLSTKSKSEFITNEAINKDLKILADSIVQVYLTINDYKNELYHHFNYDPNKKIFPLIVTLEERYLFGPELDNLDGKVREALKKKGLPEHYITDMPYSVLSSIGFECLIQRLNNSSIKGLMSNWFQSDKKGYNFTNFLVSQGNYKNINDFFPEIFESIVPEILSTKENVTR